MFEQFTVEEANLICCFDDDMGKDEITERLTALLPYFDDREMAELAEGVIEKLSAMSGEDFDALELCPEYEEYGDDTVFEYEDYDDGEA